MKLGATTTPYNAQQIKLNLFNCLAPSQQEQAEPYRTIKTVLIEHMLQHYPQHSPFTRPQGSQNLYIPIALNVPDFINFYDEMACALAQMHAQDPTCTKEQMESKLKTFTVPTIDIKKSIQTHTQLKQTQVTLPKNLLKEEFITRITNTIPLGTAYRSQPNKTFFQSKTAPDQTKASINKEASEIAISISRLLNAPPEHRKQQITQLLDAGMLDGKGKYGFETLYNAYENGNMTDVNPQDASYIARVSPVIKAYFSDKPSPQKAQAITDAFKEGIKRERAYAAMASLFTRILLGPMAPKTKFIYDPTSTEHLKSVSSHVANAWDLVSYYERSRTAQDIDIKKCVPSLAAAALVRALLGGPKFEMKLDNFLAVQSNGNIDVIPIDIELCFSTEMRPVLEALTFTNQGAMSLVSAEHTDISHKSAWNNLFKPADNENAVSKAMSDMLRRAARVLTDELIEYVVDFVINQDHEVFAITPEERNKAISFMQGSKRITEELLTKASMNVNKKDITTIAPWLTQMRADIESSKTHTSTP